MFNHLIFLKVFILSFSFNASEASSKKSFTLECKIFMELENNKITNKKMYNQKSLLIYIDKRNSWMNDHPFQDWLLMNSDDQIEIEKKFEEHKKSYFFTLRKFSDKNRRNQESSDHIKYEKFGGNIEFKKNFYNHTGSIFFSSEVRGKCKRK